jgi:pyruvate/2-oxoglutarate dehydrogenase complex dihydrolipoamide acyltransferase (E2) component
MALSEDQKAMLKLVSQPDTSYEDIAALMGLSVDEVREKVNDALAQIDAGGSAPAAEPEPPKPEPEKPKPEPAATPQAASKPAPAPKPTAATKQR